MNKTFTFKLTKPAKSNGGDRYEYGKKGDILWIVNYVPQQISRPEGRPLDKLKISYEGCDE